jgi:hypothetical protein
MKMESCGRDLHFPKKGHIERSDDPGGKKRPLWWIDKKDGNSVLLSSK